MIIDSHAHIYPEVIALKASESIGKFYDMPIKENGTLKRLFALGNNCGIDKYLVHSVATTPHQIDSITDFIALSIKTYPERLIGFTSSHPKSNNVEAEVDKALSLGIMGVKLHPDFQMFNIDSKEAMRIYEVIEGRLPLLIHTGDYRTEFSKPERLLSVIKRFPKLQVIAAHFGGWSEWDNGIKHLAGTGVYVDTSSTQFWVLPDKIRSFIDSFGEDYVLFGSDYPMWNPKDELEKLFKVFNNDVEKEKVLHGNLERLLGLCQI